MSILHLQYPFLIVGQGIAGTVLGASFQRLGIPFRIVNVSRAETASQVASGLYNPIVLKRMKPVWNANLMVEALYPFYDYCELLTGASFHHKTSVIRIFKSIQEQNDWHVLASNPSIGYHLNPNVLSKPLKGLETPYGYGEVTTSGRIDTAVFLKAMQDFWVRDEKYIEAGFDYKDISFSEGFPLWKGVAYQKIIFCEGYRTQLFNPFFNELPFAVTKGEVIAVTPDSGEAWELPHVVNGGVFIMPLNGNEFKVGATYAWNTYDEQPTLAGKSELLAKLNELTPLSVQVSSHRAGIRPTVRDRKPLIGLHASQSEVGIFNGMGSRGILMAPWLAEIFIDFLTEGKPLPHEVAIQRFSS